VISGVVITRAARGGSVEIGFTGDLERGSLKRRRNPKKTSRRSELCIPVKNRARIEDLIVEMAQQNLNWGYLRIKGALSNLGHTASRTTIANILARHGI
jgi:hypothetical protein